MGEGRDVRQALFVVLREPLQRGVSADVELRTLGLVCVAVDFDNGDFGLGCERLRYLLVIRGETLAVAAPRRVELDEHVLAGIKNDGVEIPLVHGDDGFGGLDDAHGVAGFSVEVLDDAGGVARSVVFLDEVGERAV